MPWESLEVALWQIVKHSQAEHDDHGLLGPDGGDGSDTLNTTLEVLTLGVRLLLGVMVDLLGAIVEGNVLLIVDASLCAVGGRLRLDGSHC